MLNVNQMGLRQIYMTRIWTCCVVIICVPILTLSAIYGVFTGEAVLHRVDDRALLSAGLCVSLGLAGAVGIARTTAGWHWAPLVLLFSVGGFVAGLTGHITSLFGFQLMLMGVTFAVAMFLAILLNRRLNQCGGIFRC